MKYINVEYKPQTTMSQAESTKLGFSLERTHKKNSNGDFIIDEQVIFSVFESDSKGKPKSLFQTTFTPNEYAKALGRLSSCNLKMHNTLHEMNKTVGYIPKENEQKFDDDFELPF